MRVSTLRLWITAGFGILVIELALLVYILLRTNGEINALKRTTQELRQESDRLSKEMRTVNRELGRPRRGPLDDGDGRPVTPGDSDGRRPIPPADLLSKFRDAILREDEWAAKASGAEICGLGSRGARAIIGALPQEGSPEVKRRMILLLGSIPDREVLNFLESQLQVAADKSVKIAILKSMEQQPDAPTLALLNTPLTVERDSEVIAALVEVVKKINTDDAGMALVHKYESLPEAERAAFLPLLSGFKRPVFRAFYERILGESRSPAVRLQCVKGIAEVGDASVIPVLEALKANETNEEVKREAERAIAKLRG